MNAKINNMLTEIVKHYSFEQQREIFIEECAEAIKAAQKCKRANAPEEMLNAFENFCEEVADVCVMAEQMKRYIGAEKVEGIMRDKLRRQFDRLGIDNIPIVESLEDKHHSECMQIARYSDELNVARGIIRDMSELINDVAYSEDPYPDSDTQEKISGVVARAKDFISKTESFPAIDCDYYSPSDRKCTYGDGEGYCAEGPCEVWADRRADNAKT